MNIIIYLVIGFVFSTALILYQKRCMPDKSHAPVEEKILFDMMQLVAALIGWPFLLIFCMLFVVAYCWYLLVAWIDRLLRRK